MLPKHEMAALLSDTFALQLHDSHTSAFGMLACSLTDNQQTSANCLRVRRSDTLLSKASHREDIIPLLPRHMPPPPDLRFFTATL